MPRRSRSPSYSSRSRSPPYDRTKRHLDFPPSHQIFVARFGNRTREIDLKRAFEKFGRIESIDLKDRGCFAFIVYSDARAAIDAIDSMSGRCLPHENDRLVVEQAGANKGDRRRRGRHSRSRSPCRSPRNGQSVDDLCYNCGKGGHWAAQCKEETTARRKEITEGRCFTCGEKGHKRAECSGEQRRTADRRRRFSQSRSRSRSPYVRNRSNRRDRRRRRSPSYSESMSRSPSYDRHRRGRNSRRERFSPRSYSRSRSASPRRRSGRHTEERRRSERPSSRTVRSEKKRLSSRSNSPCSQKGYKRDQRLSNIDDSNTAISTSKQAS